MSKVLAVNAGSSSLKFQLLEMPEATILVNGIVERIGLNDSILTFKYDGKKETVQGRHVFCGILSFNGYYSYGGVRYFLLSKDT